MVLREYGSGGHILESLGGAWVSNVIFFVVFPSYHCPFGQAFSSLVFYLRHLVADLVMTCTSSQAISLTYLPHSLLQHGTA